MVHLYQFGQENEICTFGTSGTGRIARVHFDPFGIRFGGADSKGDLSVWRFDGSNDAAPQRVLKSHYSGGLNDFTYLDSPNMLATTGMSGTGW